MVNAVVLITSGDIKDVNLVLKSSQLGKSTDKIINNTFVKKYLTNLGTDKIKLLNSWNIGEDILCAYGFTSGNCAEFDSSSQLYLIVVLSSIVLSFVVSISLPSN